MEKNSESSLEKVNKKLEEDTEDSGIEPHQERSSQTGLLANSWRLVNAASCTSTNVSASGKQIRVPLGTAARGSLSSQVMEYYQKYSRNSNLNKYFSLPSGNNYAAEDVKHYYSIYELNPDYNADIKNSAGQGSNFKPYIPKERRRWVRPPLIGQSSSTDKSFTFVKSMTESQPTKSVLLQHQNQELTSPPKSPAPPSSPNHSTCSPEPIITTSSVLESPPQEMSPSTASNLETSVDRKISSPTSSIASQHKPLEWDSGADVGYEHRLSTSITEGKLHQLSTIERMALARGCSAALRLDPEGTTEHQQQSNQPSGPTRATSPIVLPFTGNEKKVLMGTKPDASSTPMVKMGGNGASESENEVEITPIVKNYGIMTGADKDKRSRKKLVKEVKDVETPKSAPVFKLPLALNYSSDADDSEFKSKAVLASVPADAISLDNVESPLKKSSSMNLLASPATKLSLKRSQSDLNLCGKEKTVPPKLIFNSTSSIATVVIGNNIKPITCNKLVQTSMKPCIKESVGVQVCDCKEEEKPPLPKRATSLAPRSLCSILKTSKSTYKVQSLHSSPPRSISCLKNEEEEEENEEDDEQQNKKVQESSTDSSRNASLTPLADDTENITGRANSFEYFPGHIYENVPNGSTSHVSSVDTGRCSNSTMPNTSSSLDEKLWGDSDSLVRDLERSVNILKSLVDANKLDKQVKKRLIHHVVKRLVTAKYSDDKIEHNLEENVPWNPADARNKVYRAEIIQALAKNTTDSSDDWKPPQKKKNPKKLAAGNESRKVKDMINLPAEIESSMSDKFDRNTDRTVMDGRKARMGLHDCGRRNSRDSPTDKSESSECFLPQRGFSKPDKIKNVFVTSTSNSSPQDPNRVLLDAVVNSRRSPVDSSHDAANSADWRLPTTMSERRYELGRCSNTDSADAKLVTYAEMEKRNQLIWITNEISHLSNLKKLLEQSKLKSRRSGKSPPRKTKLTPTKSQKSLPPAVMTTQNGDVKGQLSRQWSSHCNLANCSTPVGTVKRMKKRNSCTQTVTDTSAAYSRTGSEIVSAKILSPNRKLTNVCCQTSKPLPVPKSVLPVSQVYPDCPVHRATESFSCTCSEHLCGYCKPKNLPQQHCWFADVNKEDTTSESQLECNNVDGNQKIENYSKSTKLKCNCGNAKTQEKPVKHVENTSIEVKSCSQHSQEESACSCGRNKTISHQSSTDCTCGKNLISGIEKLHINKSPRKKLFEKNLNSNCACELNKPEVQTGRTDYHFRNCKKIQPYYIIDQTGVDHQNCHCIGKTDKGKSLNHFLSPKHTTHGDRKCCRLCGAGNEKNRKCGCLVKNYPNPVAYELSFPNENKCTGEVDVEIKCIDKSEKKSKSQEECDSENEDQVIKQCSCNCQKKLPRKLSNTKCSLQDYLVSNNPNFADNVETRRQYVSEIQRLRQLRKDRRVQLLAMATTTTNIFTSSRPTKITKCVQKKISDQELKTRLRKRYSQLSEVRAKRKHQRLQEEARCNKLMAKIFCKKLQQKVLKGQVDLSQSVSVISNL